MPVPKVFSVAILSRFSNFLEKVFLNILIFLKPWVGF